MSSACSSREMQNLAERLMQKNEGNIYMSIGDCTTM